MLGSQDLGPEPPWLRTRVLCGPERVGAWVLGGALLRTSFLSPTFPRTPLAQDPGPERGHCSGTFVPARTWGWVLLGSPAQDLPGPGSWKPAHPLLRTRVLSGPGRPRSWEAWVPVGPEGLGSWDWVLGPPLLRTWVLSKPGALVLGLGSGGSGPGS